MKEFNTMKVYNIAVFMPSNLLAIVKGKTFLLDYSEHAKEEMKGDRYGEFIPRLSLTVSDKNLVELYTDDKQGIYKLLIRVVYSAKLDACYVILPFSSNWATVKTCWLCTSEDNHSTLNKSMYATR